MENILSSMNVLIVYATNSGSTEHTAHLIKDILTNTGHAVQIKKAVHTNANDIQNCELLLLGSPSWLVNNEQGQPHETMSEFLETLTENDLQKKSFAAFGCGDDSYIQFCGAVDLIESHASEKKALQIVPSLKVNSFYFDLDNNIKIIQAWAQVLAEQL